MKAKPSKECEKISYWAGCKAISLSFYVSFSFSFSHFLFFLFSHSQTLSAPHTSNTTCRIAIATASIQTDRYKNCQYTKILLHMKLSPNLSGQSNSVPDGEGRYRCCPHPPPLSSFLLPFHLIPLVHSLSQHLLETTPDFTAGYFHQGFIVEIHKKQCV